MTHSKFASSIILSAALAIGMLGGIAIQAPTAQASTTGSISVTAKTTQATVKWSKQKSATRYKVFFKKSSATKWTVRWAKSSTSTIKSLKAGTTYKVKMQAYKGSRLLSTSPTKRFTTKAVPNPQPSPSQIAVTNLQVIHDIKFGGIYVDITIDDFNKAGFKTGDSIDVTFSNGFTLKDIPYYDGYYGRDGKWLVVGYPGYPSIKICMNNNSNAWNESGVIEGTTTATLTLATAGKYAVEQETFAQVYTDQRDDLPVGTHYDQVFANFREFSTGNLKEGTLYRSASPCDEVHNRPQYVDSLMKAAGINFILNLADNVEDVDGYISAPGFRDRCPYFMSLYESGKLYGVGMSQQVLQNDSQILGETSTKGNCAMLDLGMDFRSAETRTSIAAGLRTMASAEGPYLVHCTEGKDRTGFVCFLLEALAGSSYDEMVSDYMITYDNYYGIRKDVSRAKYDALVDLRFDGFVQLLCGDDVNPSQVTPAQFTAAARNYLISGGMTDTEIDALVKAICK